MDSFDIRVSFFLKMGPWRKISHHDASEISESMIFCCPRHRSVGHFFFTTPGLLDNPKSFILDHGILNGMPSFFSLSTLSAIPRVFFFGEIPDKPSPSPEVLFLTMIVVDRALYTWYRGDRRDEENTVATAASKTLAFASMKAVGGVGVGNNPGKVGGFGWHSGCVVFYKRRSNWREGTCAG